jgi:hypothetical protein
MPTRTKVRLSPCGHEHEQGVLQAVAAAITPVPGGYQPKLLNAATVIACPTSPCNNASRQVQAIFTEHY